MPDSITKHGPRTNRRTGVGGGSVADDRHSTAPGFVSLAAGAFGVVAAILPAMGLLALVLAAVAIGAGVPVMRRGPGVAAFPYARVGVVLGMIAVLLGFLSLAMQLLG